MARESKKAKKERLAEVVRRLREEYPEPKTALEHHNPYELLVATILSAQCTDERVNMVTPDFFERYPEPEDLAGARPEEVEDLIHSTGFFRQKTKSLLGMANTVVDRHDGRIPDTMKALVKLPGVGRKTANVVLGNAFGKDEGIVVDTHVKRLAGRLGFTTETDPQRVEQDLMALTPRDDWTDISHLLIFHGRQVCNARRPHCEACGVSDLCPSSRV